MITGGDSNMTDFIIPVEAPALHKLRAGQLDHMARRAIFAAMNKLNYGCICITEDNQRHVFGEKDNASSLTAILTIHHPRFYSRILFNGSIGAAEVASSPAMMPGSGSSACAIAAGLYPSGRRPTAAAA